MPETIPMLLSMNLPWVALIRDSASGIDLRESSWRMDTLFQRNNINKNTPVTHIALTSTATKLPRGPDALNPPHPRFPWKKQSPKAKLLPPQGVNPLSLLQSTKTKPPQTNTWPQSKQFQTQATASEKIQYFLISKNWSNIYEIKRKLFLWLQQG